LQRLANIEKKAVALLRADPDDSLFCLFQALADNSLGYCATHALLCSVVCELTAQKLGFDSVQRQSLMNAALTMNIGMARDQDSLTRQSADPTDWQRTLIQEHPQKSAEILSGFDVDDPDQIDIVRWHHDPDSPDASVRTLASRRILAMADSFVAKMAARKSRASLSPVKAVKSMVMGASGDAVGVGSAMAQAAGFYPPGSYVMLANGETAVSVQRGERANTPWVVSIVDKVGMPIVTYTAKNTSDAACAIQAPLNFEAVRVVVSADKVRRARDRIPR
jgi:HD-GYP domain-containing protein (c-di-GMP phosphodiesterase class II)